MTRVLREPLLHVVVLGSLLFTLQRWMAPPEARQEIIVSGDALAGMRDDFQRRTGRPPTPEDERTILDAYVDDEVLVREGRALGLDRSDGVVRRRLIQKMRLLIESTEPVPPPAEAELERYLADNAERYVAPDRVSVDHVFVAGDDGETRARALRVELTQGADPATRGDPFPRGRDLRRRAQGELTAILGAPVAVAVMALPAGVWSEPIRSHGGWHLVRVAEKQRGTGLPLDAVRARVEDDWRIDRRAQLDRAARERLRARYVVRVEPPAS